jgi:hypothetical protein
VGFLQILALLLGSLFVIIFLAERFILFFSWLPAYFRESLPLLSRSYVLASEQPLASCLPHLERRFQANFWHPSISFQPLQTNECAFKANRFEPRFHRHSTLYGTLHFDPKAQILTITFNWPWSLLLFLIILFIFALLTRSLPLFLFDASLLFLTYALRPYGLADKIAEAVQKYLGVAGYGPPPRVNARVAKEGR